MRIADMNCVFSPDCGLEISPSKISMPLILDCLLRYLRFLIKGLPDTKIQCWPQIGCNATQTKCSQHNGLGL